MQGVKIIHKTEKLTFILLPERIVVVTPLGQQFYLGAKSKHYNRRLQLIARMITINEIRSLDELSAWCGGGVAVSWIPTYQNYTVEKELQSV